MNFNIINQKISIKGRFAWLSGKPFTYTDISKIWQAGEANHKGQSQECIGIHTTRHKDPMINDELCSKTEYKSYRYKPLCKKENGIFLTKLFWPTVRKKYSSDLKKFANSRPSASNFKSCSQSLEYFFLTVGQNNFGNIIPFLQMAHF